MRIFWQNSMGFDLAWMDDEHRRMVSLLDGVCLALHGRNLPGAAVAMDGFTQVMTSHFDAEESLLARLGGRDADRHLAVHRATSDLTGRLKSAIANGNLAESERLAGDLVDQWIRRLFHEDADLAERAKALGSKT